MLVKFTTVPTKNLTSIFAFQDLKSQASKFSDGQWGSMWTDHVNAQIFNLIALDQMEMSQVDAVVRILAWLKRIIIRFCETAHPPLP